MPQPPRRVLVVDDDHQIRDLVAVMLLEEGFEVAAAANGAAALERLREYGPDVILLDMQMPVLDGLGFAERYRRLPGPKAPIVLFSAAGPERWATEVGAHAVIEKPFDLDTLRDLVGRIAQLERE